MTIHKTLIDTKNRIDIEIISRNQIMRGWDKKQLESNQGTSWTDLMIYLRKTSFDLKISILKLQDI